MAYIGEPSLALDMLDDVVARGFFCPPILRSDPWLAPIRGEARFQALLASAEAQSDAAAEEFRRLGNSELQL